MSVAEKQSYVVLITKSVAASGHWGSPSEKSQLISVCQSGKGCAGVCVADGWLRVLEVLVCGEGNGVRNDHTRAGAES